MTERLQKILSACGLCSRREAEEWIRAGRITVNGVPASLGMSADPERDRIEADGKAVRPQEKMVYIMLNKPKGYVTTLKDEKNRPTVAELVKDCGARVYPVGRLDLNSEGLLLLTNDGEMANRLMHPSHRVDKVYQVEVSGEDPDGSAAQLRAMDSLDGERISPAAVRILRRGGRCLMEVIIHEGKNRQVRRMCAAAGLYVHNLRRVAESGLVLGKLPRGSWRCLTEDEIRRLKNA